MNQNPNLNPYLAPFANPDDEQNSTSRTALIRYAKYRMGIGLSMIVCGYLAMGDQGVLNTPASAIAMAGIGVYCWGCGNWAQAKGYPGALGLLGCFLLFGPIVIFLLPNRGNR